jgi:hypothetical protein
MTKAVEAVLDMINEPGYPGTAAGHAPVPLPSLTGPEQEDLLLELRKKYHADIPGETNLLLIVRKPT